MSPSPLPPSSSPSFAAIAVNEDSRPPLCWGAVLAGAVLALSVHLITTLLLAGLGVQMTDPLTEPEPGETFSIGLGIVWSLSALIALFVGGWAAGRLTPEPSRRLGQVHGLLVWSVATVTTVLIFTSSAGMLVGGAGKLLGRGAAAAGSGAAQVLDSDMVRQFVDENTDVLESYVSDLTEAPGTDGEQPEVSAGAAREVSWALIRYFSQDAEARSPEAETQLAQTIAESTGISEADARARIAEISESYDQIQADLQMLKEQAEQKAREAAEVASDYLTHVAVWTFLAFIIGALSAAVGGAVGAKSRREHDADVEATAQPSR